MKTKLKYIAGSTILGAITFYTGLHPETYHVLVSVGFGVLFILSISLYFGTIKK